MKRILKYAKRQRRASQQIRILGLAAITITLLLTFAGVRWFNVPNVQHRALKWISAHTAWSITADMWEWNPLTATLLVKNATIIHEVNDHYGHADTIVLKYNPWALLRGALSIRTLNVTGLVVRSEKMPAPSEPREPLKLRNLLLLRNLEIDDGTIDGVKIHLRNARVVEAKQIHLQFDPQWFGDVRLDVQVEMPRLTKDDEAIVTAKQMSISGSTNLRSWVNIAPFVNDVSGAVRMDDFAWKELTISDVHTEAHLLDSRLYLETFEVTIDDRVLQGSGALETKTQEYAIKLQWPEPMPIPALLRDTSFFVMAGTVQGSIEVQGRSFDPKAFTGTAAVDITHIPADVTDIPAHLKANGTWEAGRFTVEDGTLDVGDGHATVAGSIDVPKELIDISFEGKGIPLLGVLGRFRTVDYHPVDGTADCHGRFLGWRRNYTFDLTMDGTQNASYYAIDIENAEMTMQLTYPQLTLHGEIFQRGSITGTLDLTTKFGALREDRTRSASMNLKAQVANHKLDPSFTEFYLKGTGNGTMTVTGLSTDYRGTADIEITNGSIDIIPIEKFQTTVALRPRQLTLRPTEVKISNLPWIHLPNPAVIDINKGFRMRGTPASDFFVDFAYEAGTEIWTLHDIHYRDSTMPKPFQLKGRGKTGAWNLQLAGLVNGAWLEYIPSAFREGRGMLPINLRVQGDLDDPSINGTVALQENRIVLRSLPNELSEMNGILNFQGKRVSFRDVQGFAGDGPLSITGWLEHRLLATQRFDVGLKGHSLDFATADRSLRGVFDADLHIARPNAQRTTISGDLAIVDATYDKDFRILDHVARRKVIVERERLRKIEAGYDKIVLDLDVQSRGDVWIRNNVAEVALRAKVDVTGTAVQPRVRGTIEAAEGIIHYFGLEFEVVNGIVEFHPPFIEPSIEFTGEETIGTHLVQIVLRGPMENLHIDLHSVPGEDRKNILCLMAYGSTCDQLRNAQFGAKVGPSIFVEQVGRLLKTPINRLTGLDVVRVEPAIGSANFSQLYLGKRLSDRLEVNFVTSVGQSAAEQSLEAAYQVTDFLLLKARHSTQNKSQANISLRFRER